MKIKTNEYIKAVERMIDDLEISIENIENRDRSKGQAEMVKPMKEKVSAYCEVWRELQKVLKNGGA
jgi:hypothetical protein